MGGLYMSGLNPAADAIHASQLGVANVKNLAYEHQTAIRDLQHQVQRLSLLNQAMWELLRAKAGLTDDDLTNLAIQIDLRDGVEDGEITSRPVKCPNCLRICSSKHYKCIYCSQEFERPVFG